MRITNREVLSEKYSAVGNLLVVRSRHRKLTFAQCRAPELDHPPKA
jgi:hypothetical protein